jgi:hypothetical protein
MNQFLAWTGALLVIGAALTVPNIEDPGRYAFDVILVIYVLVFWVSLAPLLLRDWHHLRSAFAATSISAIITSGYAIAQYTVGAPFVGDGSMNENPFWGRMAGLTRHPNELGTFICMAFPFFLALAATGKSGISRLTWLGGGVIALLGVLVSGSMTAVFALAAGILGYVLLVNRRGRFFVVALVLLGTMALIGFRTAFEDGQSQTAAQRINRLVTSREGLRTYEQRQVINRLAIDYIESNPLRGHGINSTVDAMGVEQVVHNAILRAWFDGGLFTMLAMVLVLLGTGVALIRARCRLSADDDTVHVPHLAAASGAFVALLVTMMASPTLYQRSAWFPVAIALAASMIALRRRRRPSPARTRCVVV